VRQALWNIGWLVVTPAVVLWVLCVAADRWERRQPDTSEAVAGQICPGMTVDDVSRLVGGRPGEHFQSVAGTSPPHCVTWVANGGRIDVVDGYLGMAGRYDPPNGVVRSVRWSPVPPAPPRKNDWSAFAVLYGLYLCGLATWLLTYLMPAD
jgi:hypothetical protein